MRRPRARRLASLARPGREPRLRRARAFSRSLVASQAPGVLVDSREEPALVESLLEFEIVETVGGLYRCEAVFENWGPTGDGIGLRFSDGRVLDFGRKLVIRIDEATLFTGRITGLEEHYPAAGPPRIAVLAEDRLQELRMSRRTRTFEDMTDADAVNRIASDHGLRAEVDAPGPTHRVLAQVNQSDLAFLRERARAVGAEVWVDGTTLHFATRAARGGALLKLQYGSGLRELRVLADLAEQQTGVVVTGWDVSAKQPIRQEAGEATIASELAGGESGPAILRQGFGARKETIAHTAARTPAEAQAAAEAVFRMSARRFVVARGIADGNGLLRVGASVELRGVAPRFGETYYLSEVRHRFDREAGWRTEFTGERPGLEPT